MKDIGRAILNYRRAEQYLPNDTNLHQNIAFAKTLRIDQIEDKQQTQILQILFFLALRFFRKNQVDAILYVFCDGMDLCLCESFSP